MRRTWLALCTCLPLMVAAHGDHQHGSGLLQVVVEGTAVTAELHLSGADWIGFEHPPASEAEKAALMLGIALLEQPDAVMRLPAEAGCSGRLQALESPQLAPPSQKEESHGHSEVSAHYVFACQQPAALDGMTVSILEQLTALEEVRVEWVTDTNSGMMEATRGNPGVHWR